MSTELKRLAEEGHDDPCREERASSDILEELVISYIIT